MPKPGEPTTKDFKGKHCHLACKCHPNQWACHPAEDCSLNPANVAAASASATAHENGEKKTGSRQLKKAKLAAALLEEDEESQNEDDDDSVP